MEAKSYHSEVIYMSSGDDCALSPVTLNPMQYGVCFLGIVYLTQNALYGYNVFVNFIVYLLSVFTGSSLVLGYLSGNNKPWGLLSSTTFQFPNTYWQFTCWKWQRKS